MLPCTNYTASKFLTDYVKIQHARDLHIYDKVRYVRKAKPGKQLYISKGGHVVGVDLIDKTVTLTSDPFYKGSFTWRVKIGPTAFYRKLTVNEHIYAFISRMNAEKEMSGRRLKN